MQGDTSLSMKVPCCGKGEAVRFVALVQAFPHCLCTASRVTCKVRRTNLRMKLPQAAQGWVATSCGRWVQCFFPTLCVTLQQTACLLVYWLLVACHKACEVSVLACTDRLAALQAVRKGGAPSRCTPKLQCVALSTFSRRRKQMLVQQQAMTRTLCRRGVAR